jgi:tetratricopeptide (TPR) repeat protein
MNVGIFLFAAAASFLPVFACQLSPSDAAAYRTAVSSAAPLAQRRGAYEQAIRACPGEARLYAGLASLLVANHDFNTALPWIDKGLALTPDDAILNLRKGEALVALSRPKDALAALSKTPVTGESQFFRGLAHQILESHGEARRCFLDAWNHGNQDPYVLYSLMVEDKALGDRASGVEHFQWMSSRFPDSVWLHVLLGDAHFQQHQDAEARQEYLAAVKLAPDLFEPNFRLAYMTFQAGEYNEAIPYYRRALAAKPHHTEANVYLGEALRRAKHTPEAIDQLRRAIEIDPKAPLAYDSLSKALTDTGRLSEAVDVLLAGEKEFPAESSFPAMRARLLMRLGRNQEAAHAARRATELMDERSRKQAILAPK